MQAVSLDVGPRTITAFINDRHLIERIARASPRSSETWTSRRSSRTTRHFRGAVSRRIVQRQGDIRRWI